ncbi:PH domain-containing protein [Sporolactobacillus shoreicorticis]|uniref:PH domain-containing protein n=1 Tax=Sporolactobacillus shoreicorticis TaxID=1923877 RepID=A0ABW5S0C4_9BACL|nr:PH domain-containing protein [Sporolactobacillus shoreicorticis]MCO7128335.1 PH domain-containing protein [Sporolactobacillus shoreicorticis]
MSEEKTILNFETYLFGIKGGNTGFLKMPKEKYELTNERLKITKQGLVSETRDDIELFKVKDITVQQKLKDKVLDIGDIELISADESKPNLVLRRIKNPHDVREKIRTAAKEAREAAGVTYRYDL